MATPPLSNSHSSFPGDAVSDPPSQSPRLDPDYRKVRRAHRSFGAVAALLSVGYFLLYVVLSCFAPNLMNTQVAGHVTVGLFVGLSQFVIMAVTAWIYAVHMRTHVDPIVDRFREEDQQRAQQQRQNRTSNAGEFRAW